MCDIRPKLETNIENKEKIMNEDIEYKKITKNDLEEGDLVKTYNDSWLVCYKNGEKVLRNATMPSRIRSLENYTDELIDIRRFRQRDDVSVDSFDDIIAIRKHDAKTENNSGWSYSRKKEPFLHYGFK